MAKRKALSKKVRFEVFKRDGFRCAYCGSSPPKVILEVDHLIPVSAGGDNDDKNLITSCFDCNRGNGAVQLSSVTPSMADNLKQLKEKEAQIKGYRDFLKKIKERESADVEAVAKIYRDSFPGWILSDGFKKRSLKKFLELLPLDEVEDAMDLAISRMDDKDDAIKYFCGICWRSIKNEH